jgi:hypothetical protein
MGAKLGPLPLRVFENMVLRRIFVAKVKGGNRM